MSIKHIVMLKFLPEVASTERGRIAEAFAELAGAVEGITGFDQGSDVSTEDRAQGYNHVATVTFRDSAARDAYLPHPAHKAFVAKLHPLVQDILVFDYAV